MNKTAFITGASGFTGGHLLRRLIKDGWRVKALLRDKSAGDSIGELGCELVFGDLRDKQSFAQSMAGVEVVFHIAAFYRDEAGEDVFYQVNVEGTRNLIEAALEAGVKKFIHCSTVGVHGDIQNCPADEDAPFLPGDAYQKSKLAGEKIALGYIKSGRIQGAMFRPVGIYGPGDKRFLKLFKMANHKYTLIFGRGEVLYHMTYIDDLVDGIILLAQKQEALGEVFILAGPEYTTISELLQKISRILGKQGTIIKLPFAPMYALAYLSEKTCSLLRIKPLLYRRRLDFFHKNRAFSVQRARQLLGYVPRTSLEQGLKMTADWYKSQGWL